MYRSHWYHTISPSTQHSGTRIGLERYEIEALANNAPYPGFSFMTKVIWNKFPCEPDYYAFEISFSGHIRTNCERLESWPQPYFVFGRAHFSGNPMICVRTANCELVEGLRMEAACPFWRNDRSTAHTKWQIYTYICNMYI